MIADRQRIAADDRQRQPGVEQPRQMQLGEQPGEDALLGEDQLPGIDLDQIARPQRQHDAEIEQRLPCAPRIARGVVGDREGDDGRGQRDQRRHGDGAQDDVEIGGLQQLAIGLQRELRGRSGRRTRRSRRSSAPAARTASRDRRCRARAAAAPASASSSRRGRRQKQRPTARRDMPPRRAAAAVGRRRDAHRRVRPCRCSVLAVDRSSVDRRRRRAGRAGAGRQRSTMQPSRPSASTRQRGSPRRDSCVATTRAGDAVAASAPRAERGSASGRRLAQRRWPPSSAGRNRGGSTLDEPTKSATKRVRGRS